MTGGARGRAHVCSLVAHELAATLVDRGEEEEDDEGEEQGLRLGQGDARLEVELGQGALACSAPEVISKASVWSVA